jgi:hypothetical protein
MDFIFVRYLIVLYYQPNKMLKKTDLTWKQTELIKIKEQYMEEQKYKPST